MRTWPPRYAAIRPPEPPGLPAPDTVLREQCQPVAGVRPASASPWAAAVPVARTATAAPRCPPCSTTTRRVGSASSTRPWTTTRPADTAHLDQRGAELPAALDPAALDHAALGHDRGRSRRARAATWTTTAAPSCPPALNHAAAPWPAICTRPGPRPRRGPGRAAPPGPTTAAGRSEITGRPRRLRCAHTEL
jgi:hypothetical protein